MKNSETTREDVIKEIIQSVKDGKFTHRGVFIRADVTKEIEQHILHVALCNGCKTEFRGLIYSSETCEDSLHQIDYAIFSFRAKVASGEHKKMKSGEYTKFSDIMEKATKMSIEAEQEGKMNDAVNVLVMSREGVEFRSYGIIESTDSSGNVTGIVINDTPVVQNIQPDDDSEKAVLMLGPLPIENLFDFYEEDLAEIKKSADIANRLFKNDDMYFNIPTQFIEDIRSGKIDRIIRPKQPKNAKEAGRISGWNIAGEQNK